MVLVAGQIAATNWLPADGRVVNITDYEVLFDLVGTDYGGDGYNTFALPNLEPAAPNGTFYVICVSGAYP